MTTQYQDRAGTTNWQDHTPVTPVILWIDHLSIYIGDPPAPDTGRTRTRPGKSFPAVVQGRRIIS